MKENLKYLEQTRNLKKEEFISFFVHLTSTFIAMSLRAYSAMCVGACGTREIEEERLRFNPRNMKFILSSRYKPSAYAQDFSEE